MAKIREIIAEQDRKTKQNLGNVMHEATSIFDNIGNICSILGLILTVWVLTNLRRIHRHFLFQARFPDLKDKISKHRINLAQLLNTYNDSKERIEIELRKCQANLTSLKPKLGRSLRSSIKQIVKQIKKTCQSSLSLSEENVRKIYVALVQLEEELENLKQDIEWGLKE